MRSEVLGEKSYARLEDIPEHVDIVDIFRRSEFVAPVVESAIRHWRRRRSGCRKAWWTKKPREKPGQPD